MTFSRCAGMKKKKNGNHFLCFSIRCRYRKHASRRFYHRNHCAFKYYMRFGVVKGAFLSEKLNQLQKFSVFPRMVVSTFFLPKIFQFKVYFISFASFCFFRGFSVFQCNSIALWFLVEQNVKKNPKYVQFPPTEVHTHTHT